MNKQDGDNRTPLLMACMNGHSEVAMLLIQNGANINISDNKRMTPLLYACKYNLSQVAILLMERGADIHACDRNNWSPLHWACLLDNPMVMTSLLKRGADVYARISTCGFGSLFARTGPPLDRYQNGSPGCFERPRW